MVCLNILYRNGEEKDKIKDRIQLLVNHYNAKSSLRN